MTPKDDLFNHKHNAHIRADYRPDPYRVTDVDLKIDMDAESSVVRNRMWVEANPKAVAYGGPLVLNGESIDLEAVRIFDENGKPRDLDRSEFLVDDKQLILLRPPAHRFQVEVVNRFSPAENTKLSGIYQSGNILASHCEMEGFRRITYYMDRSDNMAKFTVTLEADKQKYPVLISNGNGDCTATTDLGNGRHTITFVDPKPKSSYLFAGMAGDFEIVKDSFVTMSGRKVRLSAIVEKGYEDQVEHALESAKKTLAWVEKNLGFEYDYDDLRLIGIEKFNAGAMENKTAIAFNIKDLCGSLKTSTDAQMLRIETVVAHEILHHWFGDIVTVLNKFEISLKESLTEHTNERFSSDMNSAAIETIDTANVVRTAQFAEDAGPTAHCVRPDRVEDFENLYSTTVYRKGARIIDMERVIIGGDAPWYKALMEYVRKFSYQAIIVDNFIDNIQDVSGINMTQFRRWYSQSGTPEISYEGTYDAKAKTYTLKLKQRTPATADQPESEKKPLHIPVSVGLIGASGNDIPLVMEGDGANKNAVTTRVLNLTEAEQTFVFKNVSGPVVPSILRGFSAPVKITTLPSDGELIFRMAHDSDAFNRYEAGERLMVKTIRNLLKDHADGLPLTIPQAVMDAYAANLSIATSGDMAFAARMLSVPSMDIITQGMKGFDPDVVREVADHVRATLAETFKDEFSRVYQETKTPKGEKPDVTPEQVGRRELHNLALGYLSRLDDVSGAVLSAQAQFKKSKTMSEKFSSLSVLARVAGKAGGKALEEFYQEYKSDVNVVDMWLSLNASLTHGDPVARVRELMEHEAFDLTNPNKVRALIGGFMGNWKAFHNKDGSGYKLLADVVIALNDVNPHTAAGIVGPLTKFVRFDEARQKLMIEQLERIYETPKLNSQVKDMVGKALEQAKAEKAAVAPQKKAKNTSAGKAFDKAAPKAKKPAQGKKKPSAAPKQPKHKKG